MKLCILYVLSVEIYYIYDALIEICEDLENSYHGVPGTAIRVEAQGLAKGISKFKFLFQLITWYKLLYEINISSKLLQDKNFNIQIAKKYLESTGKYLKDLRSDAGFNTILQECTDLARENEFETELDSDPVRIRRKKKQFHYEGDDEPIADPIQKLKIEFFFTAIDMAINSIDERFAQMHQLESIFGEGERGSGQPAK